MGPHGVGDDEAGDDRVDPHALLAVAGGHVHGQGVDAGLGDPVGGPRPVALERGPRGHVDDGAAAVPHHLGDGVLAGEHLAAQVDGHGPLPDLQRQLGHLRCRADRKSESVRAALLWRTSSRPKRRRPCRSAATTVVLLGEVGCAPRWPCRPDAAMSPATRARPVTVDVDDGDRRPLPGPGPGPWRRRSPRPAGDDGHLAFDAPVYRPTHCCHPCFPLVGASSWSGRRRPSACHLPGPACRGRESWAESWPESVAPGTRLFGSGGGW